MKNKIYFLGIMTCLLITTGCIFKMVHWPMANIIFALGMLSLIFLFIPIAFSNSFKAETNKKLKMLYILSATVISINSIGALFKVMSWPGANALMIISLPLPFIILLPAYLRYYKNEPEINYNNFMAILFFFAYFAAISALLALGVSKNIIDSFIRSANTINGKTEIVNQQCHIVLNTHMADSSMNKKTIDSYQEINNQADMLCQKINEIKKVLINHASSNSDRSLYKNGKPNLWKIKSKDSKPKLEVFYLEELKNELNVYKALLASNSTNNNSFKNYIEEVFNTNDTYDDKWELVFTQDHILVSLIEKLNFLEYHIRLAEYEVLNEL